MNRSTTAPRGLRPAGQTTKRKQSTPGAEGRKAAIAAGVVLVVSLLAGVAIPTGLEVPARDTSVSGLLIIVRSNLILLAALGACAGLQVFARREAAGGNPPWIRRITDLVVIVFVVANVGATGFTIGQLGVDAIVRIVPHGLLEVPAFALAVWGYLLARKGLLDSRRAWRIYLAATLMLLAAAPIETFVTGSVK